MAHWGILIDAAGKDSHALCKFYGELLNWSIDKVSPTPQGTARAQTGVRAGIVPATAPDGHKANTPGGEDK